MTDDKPGSGTRGLESGEMDMRFGTKRTKSCESHVQRQVTVPRPAAFQLAAMRGGRRSRYLQHSAGHCAAVETT